MSIKPGTPVNITRGPFKGHSGKVVTIQRPNDKLVYAIVDIEGSGSHEAIPVMDLKEDQKVVDIIIKQIDLLTLKVAHIEKQIANLEADVEALEAKVK